MAVLLLRILGDFAARRSTGEAVEIPIRKGKALLAFLALKPDEAVARSKLTGLLWGDRSEKQARTNLRQTLTVLRKALGPGKDRVLRADRQSVGLDSASLDVDALSFQNLIASGTPADLETAVSLYRGELLEGLDLPDPGFQAWLEDERRRFHGLMTAALHALMERKREIGAPQDAIVLAESLLALEPLREDVHCALMVLYAELGRRDAVHRQYQRCRDLLASELDIEPAAETEALYQMLLDGDRAIAGCAEENGAIVVSPHEIDDGVEVAPDDWSERPPIAIAGGSRGAGRWAIAAGQALIIGGIFAFTWLLAWGHPFRPIPPDIMAFLRIDVLASDNLSNVQEDVSESSGPASMDRMALRQPGEPSTARLSFDSPPGMRIGGGKYAGRASLERLALARLDGRSRAGLSDDSPSGMPEGVTASSGPAAVNRVSALLPDQPARALASVDSLSGVLERATDYAAAPAPDDSRLAMHREAEGRWAELAESWNLRAVRAFKTRYPEAEQADEAESRIAFLVRHQSDAQAELNRLGYDAGPVDGIWGVKSSRAMRAFQADSGLARDGVLTQVSLEQLKAAAPKIEAAAILATAPEPQPDRAEPEIAVASVSAQESIPEGSRWTAFGKSRDGSAISATATRRGDTLEIAFDVDHRGSKMGGLYSSHYKQSCTVSVVDPVAKCWIPGMGGNAVGAIVSGSFPRFTFQVTAVGYSNYALPGDIVLEFSPEQQLAQE